MKKSKRNKLRMIKPVFTWVFYNGVQIPGNDNEYKTYLKNNYTPVHSVVCIENKQ